MEIIGVLVEGGGGLERLNFLELTDSTVVMETDQLKYTVYTYLLT